MCILKKKYVSFLVAALLTTQISSEALAQSFSSSKLLPECIDQVVQRHKQVFAQDGATILLSSEDDMVVHKAYLLSFWDAAVGFIQEPNITVSILTFCVYGFLAGFNRSIFNTNSIVQEKGIEMLRERSKTQLAQIKKVKLQYTFGSPAHNALVAQELKLNRILKMSQAETIEYLNKISKRSVFTVFISLVIGNLFYYLLRSARESNKSKPDIQTTTSALENAATNEELLQYLHTKDENSQMFIAKAFELCQKVLKMSDEDVLNLNFDAYIYE